MDSRFRGSDENMKLPASFPRRRAGAGSLASRVIGISVLWIAVLLGAGGYALDRVLTTAITRAFDVQLEDVMTALIASAEIGSDSEPFLNRAPANQRFLEPNSGLYFEISGPGHEPFRSRSLWDRALKVSGSHTDFQPHTYNSLEFGVEEKLRIEERDVQLPGSPVRWRFQVAESREG